LPPDCSLEIFSCLLITIAAGGASAAVFGHSYQSLLPLPQSAICIIGSLLKIKIKIWQEKTT
jgi:hypothetical protein